jgi:formylglycine-generating enzyme required for sulfatase activity
MLKKKLILLCSGILLMLVSCCSEDEITSPPETIDPIASMPTNFTILNPEIDILELYWEDNCNWEKEIRVDRRIDDEDYTEWINIARLPTNSTFFSDNNVPYQTNIEYRIYAYYDDTMHSEYSVHEYYITLSNPDSLEIVKLDDSSLKLTWHHFQDWIDGYKLQRKVDEDDWVDYAVLDKNIEEFIDSGLNLNECHVYKIFSAYGEETSYGKLAGYNKIEMIFVEGGTFNMGNTWENISGDTDEYPVHEVTLSSYYIGKFEITDLSWDIYRGYYDNNTSPVEPGVCMAWTSAIEFCNYLSKIENLEPCYIYDEYFFDLDEVELNLSANGYRLPTEAEWEYAARGGIHFEDNFIYSGSNNFDDVGWYSYGHEIGQKEPNQLGIYDMSGNCKEYCWDIYGEYSSENQINPTGADEGDSIVLRGNSNHISDRESNSGHSACEENSFRIVRKAE